MTFPKPPPAYNCKLSLPTQPALEPGTKRGHMEGVANRGQSFGRVLTMTKIDPELVRPSSSGWTGGSPGERDNGAVKECCWEASGGPDPSPT